MKSASNGNMMNLYVGERKYSVAQVGKSAEFSLYGIVFAKMNKQVK